MSSRSGSPHIPSLARSLPGSQEQIARSGPATPSPLVHVPNTPFWLDRSRGLVGNNVSGSLVNTRLLNEILSTLFAQNQQLRLAQGTLQQKLSTQTVIAEVATQQLGTTLSKLDTAQANTQAWQRYCDTLQKEKDALQQQIAQFQRAAIAGLSSTSNEAAASGGHTSDQ